MLKSLRKCCNPYGNAYILKEMLKFLKGMLQILKNLAWRGPPGNKFHNPGPGPIAQLGGREPVGRADEVEATVAVKMEDTHRSLRPQPVALVKTSWQLGGFAGARSSDKTPSVPDF